AAVRQARKIERGGLRGGSGQRGQVREPVMPRRRAVVAALDEQATDERRVERRITTREGRAVEPTEQLSKRVVELMGFLRLDVEATLEIPVHGESTRVCPGSFPLGQTGHDDELVTGSEINGGQLDDVMQRRIDDVGLDVDNDDTSISHGFSWSSSSRVEARCALCVRRSGRAISGVIGEL